MKETTPDVAQAMKTLAAQTMPPTPPPYHVIWLRAEYARRQQRHARRDPLLTFLPVALAVALIAALFLWSGAPPQNLVRESIALAARSSLFTGGVGLAVLLGFVMLAFVLTEESSTREP